MRRSYDHHHCNNYYHNNSMSPIDEDFEYFTQMQRMHPHHTPNAHNNSFYIEEHEDHHHHQMSPKGYYQHKGPEMHKTVYFVEHKNTTENEKHEDHHHKSPRVHHQHKGAEMHKKVNFVDSEKPTEIGRDGKREVYYEEKSIDAEADGFIQRKHKNFEAYNYKSY